MPGNSLQRFSDIPHIGAAFSGLGPNTAMDGTGTVVLVFTAGANGSRIERGQALHMGVNNAGMLRFFWNNGTGLPSVAANNSLIEELPMAANPTLSQAAASVPGILQRVPIILGPSERIYAAVTVTLAAGYQITLFGGNY